MAHQVLLLGHSYVRLLDGHMRRFGFVNLQMNPEIYDVHIAGDLGKSDKIIMTQDARDRVLQILGELPPSLVPRNK